MQLRFLDDLPYAELIIVYQTEKIKVDHVLDDTGSASAIISSDLVGQTGITPQPDDPFHTIRGVGGFEDVFSRTMDSIRLGQEEVHNTEVEFGGMDHGFEINGVLDEFSIGDRRYYCPSRLKTSIYRIQHLSPLDLANWVRLDTT